MTRVNFILQFLFLEFSLSVPTANHCGSINRPDVFYPQYIYPLGKENVARVIMEFRSKPHYTI